jgi:hypothetical protein
VIGFATWRLGLLMTLVVPMAVALAAEWAFSYRTAAVQYAVYGGGLGDPVKPDGRDAKVAFEVTGRAAQDLFAAIGPDRVDRCGAEPGVRFRSRDGDKLACQRSAAGEFRCQFGFDLITGKSIGGSIC